VLKKPFTLKIVSLCSLLTMMLIVVLPAIHPFLHHHHSGCDHAICCAASESIRESLDSADPECPVCEFLATCHLHAARSAPPLTVRNTAAALSPAFAVASIKAVPGSVEARAPPLQRT
jgi:hypothetical protein